MFDSAARYDKIAAHYDFWWRRYSEATSAEVLRQLRRSRLDWRGVRVLDVGAGSGFFLEKLRAKHPEIARMTALDPSAAMLQQARRKLGDDSNASLSTTDFVLGNAEKLPFENASFDVVISMNALHYLDTTQQFFAEANRVLDVGGVLIVQDYMRNGWPFFAAAMRVCDAGTRRLYSVRDLSDGAETADFAVEHAREFQIDWFWRGVLLCARKPISSDPISTTVKPCNA